MSNMPVLSRRRFLLGSSAEAPLETEISAVAVIHQSCLALNGTACMTCRDACPFGAVRLELALGGGRPRIDGDRCTGCGECTPVCPAGAISLAALQEVS